MPASVYPAVFIITDSPSSSVVKSKIDASVITTLLLLALIETFEARYDAVKLSDVSLKLALPSPVPVPTPNVKSNVLSDFAR